MHSPGIVLTGARSADDHAWNERAFVFGEHGLLGCYGKELWLWRDVREPPQVLWKAPQRIDFVAAAGDDIAVTAAGCLWHLAAGASEPRMLVDLVCGTRPVWSPDHQRVAAACGEKGFAVVHVGTGDVVRDGTWNDADPVSWSDDGLLLVEHDQLGKFREWYYLWREGLGPPVEVSGGVPYWTSPSGTLRVRHADNGVEVEHAGRNRWIGIPDGILSQHGLADVGRSWWLGDDYWCFPGHGISLVDLQKSAIAQLPGDAYQSFLAGSLDGRQVLISVENTFRVVQIDPTTLDWEPLTTRTVAMPPPFPEPKPEADADPEPEPERSCPAPGPTSQPAPQRTATPKPKPPKLPLLDPRLEGLVQAALAIDDYDSEFGTGDWLAKDMSDRLDELEGMGDEGIELLLTTLPHRYPEALASSVAERLGHMGHRATRAFDALAAIPPSHRASYAAAAACVRIDPLGALGCGFFRSKKHRIRQGALLAVDADCPEAVRREVIALLHSPDHNIRQDALETVMRLGDVDPLDTVTHLMRDPDAYTRAKAIGWVSEVDDPAAVPLLIEALCASPTSSHQALKRVAEDPGAIEVVHALLDDGHLEASSLDGWRVLEILAEGIGTGGFGELQDELVAATEHALLHAEHSTGLRDYGGHVFAAAAHVAAVLDDRRLLPALATVFDRADYSSYPVYDYGRAALACVGWRAIDAGATLSLPVHKAIRKASASRPTKKPPWL